MQKTLLSAGMPAGILMAGILMAGLSCKKHVECTNGTCVCEHGADCNIDCQAPPCHVICKDSGTYCNAECGNGECICEPGAECDFDCQSPPCHVDCQGNDRCSGVCANGECDCSLGSTCDFDCLAGPCHVNCAGDNPSCNGVCANGTCTCGANSICEFSCKDSDCRAACESGSKCILECPAGNPGAQGCSYSSCRAGEPLICPDGIHIVCGAACPAPSSSLKQRSQKETILF
jgi:hypothetical protein